jgi:hypothetical protein
MKDEFDELVEEMDLDSIQDFEAKSAWYQVWLFAYDKEMNILDTEIFIDESKDPNKAIEYAQTFIAEDRYKGLAIPEEAYFLSVEVETVVDYEDHTENVGTIYQDGIKIKES